MMGPVRSGGFTLVEVLVALSIVAISLMAGLQAVGALMRTAERQSDMLLAQICAENELIRLRLARRAPAIGSTTAECFQAGLSFSTEVTVSASANPNFRRVDVRVLRGSQPLLVLASVQGAP